jgi:hypothetical protein
MNPLIGAAIGYGAKKLAKKAVKKAVKKKATKRDQKISEKQIRTMTQYSKNPSGREAAVQNIVRLKKKRAK